MQELERVKTYTRKVYAAEQVPTDRTLTLGNLLMKGNLVVDKPAAQRMIMHSIPKNQIVPDPNSKTSSITPGKRVAEEISNDQSSPEEGEVRASKKPKVEQCKSTFRTLITEAEAITIPKSLKKKGNKRKSPTAEGAETSEKAVASRVIAPIVVGNDVLEVAERTVVNGNSKKKQKKKGKNGKAGPAGAATETDDVSSSQNAEIEPKKKKTNESKS